VDIKDNRSGDRRMNEFLFCRLAEAIDDYRSDYQRHNEVKVIMESAPTMLSFIHKDVGRVRDGLADHQAEMLVLEVGQVNERVEAGCFSELIGDISAMALIFPATRV